MVESAETGALVPNAPVVVSETIAGETIIMHHGSGHYFDTTGTGATLWDAIAGGGATVARLAELLVIRHGAAPAEARDAAERFVGELERHDLVRASAAAPVMRPAGPAGEPFAEPVLGVHTDLADMLLLDPIHDVGEAGWPTMPVPAGAASP